jgi:hypothetical protein
MLNMSAKIGEARERMILKTQKSTPSLDRRMTSARVSSKGAPAVVLWDSRDADMMNGSYW